MFIDINFHPINDGIVKLKRWLDNYVSNATAVILIDSSANIKSNTSFGCVYASFLGDWQKKFNPKYTMEGDFLNHFQTLTTVQMIGKNYLICCGNTKYEAFRRIDIPYAKSTQLTIITKNDLATGTHIRDIVFAFSRDCHFMDRFGMADNEVELHLPKFNCRSSITILKLIREVNGDAKLDLDFSNAVDGPFKNQSFTHVAAIRTDETGTEAYSNVV